MNFSNTNALSRGVSEERVKEFKDKCKKQGRLHMQKICWIGIIVSLVIMYFLK